MTWTFLILLLWPDGQVTAPPMKTFESWDRCQDARELENRKPIPQGVEGRMIGICRKVEGT